MDYYSKWNISLSCVRLYLLVVCLCVHQFSFHPFTGKVWRRGERRWLTIFSNRGAAKVREKEVW